MSKYPSYDEMKDSGIEWLGEIPEHWGMVKLKYITSCLDNRRIPLNSSERSEMQGEYPYYGANGIVDWVNDFIFDEKIILLGEDGAPFKEFGKEVAFLINEKCWVNNHAHILKADGINPIFLTYSLNCVNYNPYLSGSTRYKLTQNDMKKINIAFPPLKEQQAIADFLDQETGRIDELIEKKEKLIELLEEKRQATISQAVTKGLDSDVEMKDSGVEWLGDIPEHWSMVKLSWVFREIGSGTTPSSNNKEYYNGDIPWVNTTELNDSYIKRTNKKISGKALEDYSSLNRYSEGSLLIALYGATIGKLGILKISATTNQACCALSQPIDSVNTRFVFYWLLGNRSYIISLSYGGGQSNISQELVKQLKITLPKNNIQEKIVNYLDQETNRIDNLIEKTKEQIANLEEYKQALISNAVTGKIKVTEEL